MRLDRRFSVTRRDNLASVTGFLAPALRKGDVVALWGELGVGKTAFASELIHALIPVTEPVEVVSPTFPIVRLYDGDDCAVAHCDLYRVEDGAELEELGLAELRGTHVLLVEWPDRWGNDLPVDALEVSITVSDDVSSADAESRGAVGEGREVVFRGSAVWAARIRRMEEVRAFLDRAGWVGARSTWMQGDASTRQFQRISLESRTAVLVDDPEGGEGDPSACIEQRRLRPESLERHVRKARLACGIRPFTAIAGLLQSRGVSIPRIYAADLEQGLVLEEDLGTEGVVAGDPPVPIVSRYEACVDFLVFLAQERWPDRAPDWDGKEYRLPVVDETVFLAEAELFLDWFVPYHTTLRVDASARARYVALWRAAFERLERDRWSLVLRDFHSPNILWQGGHEGKSRVGLVDFQDAAIFHPAYDAISLIRDARVDIPEGMAMQLLDRYVAGMKEEGFDAGRLLEACAILGAQRQCKILGGFSCLAAGCGKPQYLKHMPRILEYLSRDMGSETLSDLREWFGNHLPEILDREPRVVA